MSPLLALVAVAVPRILISGAFRFHRSPPISVARPPPLCGTSRPLVVEKKRRKRISFASINGAPATAACATPSDPSQSETKGMPEMRTAKVAYGLLRPTPLKRPSSLGLAERRRE